MNRRWKSLGCVLALAGLGLWGCDNNTTDTDAGGGGTDGGGGGDAGAMAAPVVMAFDGTDTVAADLSCMGTRTAPTPGAATDFPARVVARGVSDMAAPAVMVQLFQDNVVPNGRDACESGCVAFTSDSSGEGTVNLLADGWFAYRILSVPGAMPPNTTTATVVAYNQDTELSSFMTGATPAVEFSQIGAGLFNSALGAAMVTAQPGTGIFTGFAYDCAGNPLVNARIRAFSPTGEVMGGTARQPTGPRYVYWTPGGLFPSRDLPATSTEGRFAGGNMPFEDTIRIELWGLLSESDSEETKIGCEEIGGAGDRVNLIDIHPMRSDAPASCL